MVPKPFQAVGTKLLKRRKSAAILRELEIVKQERDIVKKAISIFSREKQ